MKRPIVIRSSRHKRSCATTFRAARRPVGALTLAVIIGLWSQARAQVLSGKYTGDNVDGRSILQLGFMPDFLLIKPAAANGGTTATSVAVMRTSTSTDDSANTKQTTSQNTLRTNMVQKLLNSGFEVGNAVNTNGVNTLAYYWLAIKADSDFKVGSYVGNGNDDRSIVVEAGFQPDMVWVLGDVPEYPLWRTSTMAANAAIHYDDDRDANDYTDTIQSFNANGFVVGTRLDVNANNSTYHYAAWKSVAGKFAVGTYVGDGNDDRDYTDVGFEPEYVGLRNINNLIPSRHKFSSTGKTTDYSFTCKSSGINNNWIQQILSNGFQIGTDVSVNANGSTYHWHAMARQSPTAVSVDEMAAHWDGDGVRISWRTGYESDSLGFFVHQEGGDGRRHRVSDALIPAALLSEGLVASPVAGRSYSYRHQDEAAAGSSVYWIEAVDAAGISTWHGPIKVSGPPTTPAALASASALTALLPTGSKRLDPKFFVANTARRTSATFGAIGLAATALPAPTASEDQRQLLGRPSLRVMVSHDGWYRLTQAELIRAGMDENIDPRTLRLFFAGQEQPLLVSGESDGRLDPEDRVEFYGRGIASPFSNHAVYFLGWGDSAGKRIRLSREAPRALVSGGFEAVVEKAERKSYFASLLNGDNDNFFGPLIARKPVEQTLATPRPDRGSGANAQLDVTIQGATFEGHKVEVELNGERIGAVELSDRATKTASLVVPLAKLRDGDNTVRLSATGSPTDLSFLHSLRLAYPHTFEADDDALKLTVPPAHQVTLRGFGGTAITVLDVTDPGRPEKLEGEISPDRETHAITVVAPEGVGPRTLVAFTEDKARTPAVVSHRPPSTEPLAATEADFLILGPAPLLREVEPLRNARQARGWRVKVADVQDVYDEYGFGHKSPAAIREFLVHAWRGWQRKPRAVLLLGDASYDPKGDLGLGELDLMPTKLIDTSLLETASDEWFVDFDDDGVGELAIGRLPARTAAQTRVMVDKILAHDDSSPSSGARVLFLTGRDQEYRFTSMSDPIVQAASSAGFTVDRLSFDQIARRDPLLQGLAGGPTFVNYFGHGSVEQWTGLLKIQDLPALAPATPKPAPVYLNMTCLNGFFHDLYTESFAETLLRSEDGGAAAVWASSTLAYPTQEQQVNAEIYRALGRGLSLGDAARAAKQSIADSDIRRSWILFGDPTMFGRPPSLTATGAETGSSSPVVDGDPLSSPTDGGIATSASGATGCGCNLARRSSPAIAWFALALFAVTIARPRRRR